MNSLIDALRSRLGGLASGRDCHPEQWDRAAARITTALARRYSHHPALAMWHTSNEFGPAAYDAQSSVAFREWLRRRYGTELAPPQVAVIRVGG